MKIKFMWHDPRWLSVRCWWQLAPKNILCGSTFVWCNSFIPCLPMYRNWPIIYQSQIINWRRPSFTSENISQFYNLFLFPDEMTIPTSILLPMLISKPDTNSEHLSLPLIFSISTIDGFLKTMSHLQIVDQDISILPCLILKSCAIF